MEREARRRQAGVEEASKGVWSLMDLAYISALQLLTRTLFTVPIPSRAPGRSIKCWAEEPAQYRVSSRKDIGSSGRRHHLPPQDHALPPGTRTQVNHL